MFIFKNIQKLFKRFISLPDTPGASRSAIWHKLNYPLHPAKPVVNRQDAKDGFVFVKSNNSSNCLFRLGALAPWRLNHQSGGSGL
jgi:hypothetical protein